ncbi:MAG: hypothetical protein LBQ65_06180 [Tannerellaceae bacterium]|jgi:uncharacterized protein (UPF0210 family)|nr:hypothetical protein [Tannerellaceae bacterium]
MKKIVLMLATAAFMVSFAACGGKSSTQTETTTDESTENQTEETLAPAAAEGDVLAKYEEFVNKAIDLYPKVIAGDAAAAQEYVKLSQEIAEVAEELGTAFANLTPEQQQKFTELGQKFVEAATKAMPQE